MSRLRGKTQYSIGIFTRRWRGFLFYFEARMRKYLLRGFTCSAENFSFLEISLGVGGIFALDFCIRLVPFLLLYPLKREMITDRPSHNTNVKLLFFCL